MTTIRATPRMEPTTAPAIVPAFVPNGPTYYKINSRCIQHLALTTNYYIYMQGRLGTLDTKAPLILSDYLVTYLLNNNKQGTSVFRKSFRPSACVLMRLEVID